MFGAEGSRETISDPEMMERRLMGFDHSPIKDGSFDKANSEGSNGEDAQNFPQDASGQRLSHDSWERSNDAAVRSSVGAQELLRDEESAGQAVSGKRADEVQASAIKEREREGAEQLANLPAAASPPGNGAIPKSTTRADSVTPAKSGKLQDRLKMFEEAAKPVGQQPPATRPAIRLQQPDVKELSKESRPARAQEAVPQKHSGEETVSIRNHGDKVQPARGYHESEKAVIGNDAEIRLSKPPHSPSTQHPHSFETHPESYMAPFQGFRYERQCFGRKM